MHDLDDVRRLLERDLIEWADDVDLRLVWADLLQLDGDPLGRLVVLDHVGQRPGAAAARARAEAQALRERVHERLWAQGIPALDGVELRWHMGFVRELELEANELSTEGTLREGLRYRWPRREQTPDRLDALERLMPRLLSEPALRWLEVVRIRVDDSVATRWLHWASQRSYCGTLREIHIGRPPRLRARPQGPWEPGTVGSGRGPQTDRLIQHFRRLRWLSVGGEMVRLPCCEGSSQTRAHHLARLATRPLTSPNRASLARGLWDVSSLVHQAAFESARALGSRADFLLDDLIWFLRPPLSKKDPRPVEALRTLASIGPASAGLLPEVLTDPRALVGLHARREALMDWLAALGRAASPARSLIDAVLADKSGTLPKSLRSAAKRARKAVSA